MKTILKNLGDALENVSHSFYDYYVEANVKTRQAFGIKQQVVRRQVLKCCDWCADLAGIYTYPDVPSDIWARHNNCRCQVTFTSNKNGAYKDVWSKQEYKTQREARVARLAEINNENVTAEIRIKKINAAAIQGAYNDKNDPYMVKRDEHAQKYYESVRNSDKEFIVNTISKNTGVSKDKIRKVIEHVFINEYNLEGKIKRFDASYDMAESIRRLRDGKNIQKHDLILIEHEFHEHELMSKQGMDYDKAHEKTNVLFNYRKALTEWKENAEISPNKK